MSWSDKPAHNFDVFSHDARGRMTSQTRSLDGGPGDSNFRLSGITHGVRLPDFLYQYDRAGNIKQINSNGRATYRTLAMTN